ncbi:MAG TPA: nucleotidyltransferase domain-containing protein [Balneolaceae bacterium]
MENGAKKYIEQRLPQRLMDELYGLAEKYRYEGVKLFVFGSFAKLDDRQTSDLDLGVAWIKERSPIVFSKLYRDVMDLPTIRKIDLIDVESVDESFRNHIMKDAVFLSEEKEAVV